MSDPAPAATPETPAPAAPRFPLLCLLRPRQWIKNAFVLAPLLFAGKFRDPEAIQQACFAAFLFCLGAAAVYILNDLLDVERDRRHPTKRLSRPLAAGAATTTQAVILLAVLEAALLAGILAAPRAVFVILGYQFLNALYSAKLKHVPILDLFCIAAGFVLRIYAGAVALDVPLSPWMLNTTLCLALHLAAVKRRQELSNGGPEGRAVLEHYTAELLNYFAFLAAVCAVVFYSLFTLTVRTALEPTIPLVLLGFFRYWYIVVRKGGGESPTDAVWQDWPLALIVLAWVALCGVLMATHGMT
jgi:decaprenyl-phosphate phosphoribosyltransferase